MNYEYSDGKYCLYNEVGNIVWSGSEVAICLSYHPELEPIRATLLKHGDPNLVEKWYYTYLSKLQDAYRILRRPEYLKEMKQLVMVRGRIPVEELNKCISNLGYVARFVEKMILCDFVEKEK